MRERSELEDYARFQFARRALRGMGDVGYCAHDEPYLEERSDPWVNVIPVSSRRPANEDQRVGHSNATVHALEQRVRALEERLAELSSRQLEQTERAAQSATSQPPYAFLEALISEVRARASELDGVTSAYVKPDGRSFILGGPEWSEALSEAGATLAIKVQQRLAPTGDPYIEGGFIDIGDRAIPDWLKVYP